MPVKLNSHIGTAVAPPGAAGHLPPAHLGMHMQPPKGNLAGTACMHRVTTAQVSLRSADKPACTGESWRAGGRVGGRVGGRTGGRTGGRRWRGVGPRREVPCVARANRVHRAHWQKRAPGHSRVCQTMPETRQDTRCGSTHYPRSRTPPFLGRRSRRQRGRRPPRRGAGTCGPSRGTSRVGGSTD